MSSALAVFEVGDEIELGWRLLLANRLVLHLSFPKIPSARIRAMRQNQRIILRDAWVPSAAWDVCRQPIQVAAPA